MDEKFVIDNDAKANWAVKTIKEARERRDRCKAVADTTIAEQEQVKADADKRYEYETENLLSGLAEYFESLPYKVSKTQESFTLPAGKLVRKLGKQDYKVNDGTLTSWLKENGPDYIETKEKPKWGEFKKDLKIQDGMVVRESTGEIVEGVEVVAIPSSFDVKF